MLVKYISITELDYSNSLSYFKNKDPVINETITKISVIIKKIRYKMDKLYSLSNHILKIKRTKGLIKIMPDKTITTMSNSNNE